MKKKMKVKLAPRKVVKALVKAGVIGKAKRVPLAALPVAITPTPAPAPVLPAPAPTVKATDLKQGRNNRAWFQMAKDDGGVIQARIDAVRAKAGHKTMNDMAAEMFELLCSKYGV